jgi:aminoglycoside phosphotransferase family enzyme/predicted kinase
MQNAAHLTDESLDRVNFLRSPLVYPDHPLDVQVVETHISWVFLTDRHAYKLKKPIAFDFLDYSTVERRHEACLEELRLNRRLAPDIYQSVMPITLDRQGRRRIGGMGRIDDWLVRMRRLPAECDLDRILEVRELTSREIHSLADKLFRFYATLPPLPVKTLEFRRGIERHVRENWETLAQYASPDSQELVDRVHAAQCRLLALYPHWWDERVCDGRVVEGHGDLRCDHVYFAPQPLVIDALEFNADLRTVDVLDELSFLAMECECLHGSNAGRQVRERYCDAAGDHPPQALLEFYEAYRACVRAKVGTLRAAQQSASDADQSLQRASQLLAWSDERLAAATPPLVVVVRGRSGVGKSRLAEMLANALGAKILSTDGMRGELQAEKHPAPREGFGEGRYTTANRQAVYDALIERALGALESRRTLIIDGVFPQREQRRRLRERVEARGAIWVLFDCHCPIAIARQRIEERAAAGHGLSEITPEMLELQAREDEPLTTSEQGVSLNTYQPFDHLVDQALQAIRSACQASERRPQVMFPENQSSGADVE